MALRPQVPQVGTGAVAAIAELQQGQVSMAQLLAGLASVLGGLQTALSQIARPGGEATAMPGAAPPAVAAGQSPQPQADARAAAAAAPPPPPPPPPVAAKPPPPLEAKTEKKGLFGFGKKKERIPLRTLVTLRGADEVEEIIRIHVAAGRGQCAFNADKKAACGNSYIVSQHHLADHTLELDAMNNALWIPGPPGTFQKYGSTAS